jgi:lycopene cyclase-like protein
MDYRSDHLSEDERRQPPTFLYAMDLGDGRFFVEETSLALAPAVPFPVLRQRLLARLAHRGVRVEAIEHEEFCLFPMNPPLPDLNQPVVGFGGAAGMVHPASGFMVGSVLRRSPGLAAAIASALDDPTASAESVAAAVVDVPRLMDHARWDAPKVARLLLRAQEAGAEAVIVTPKDWMKIAPLGVKSELPLVRPRLAIEFLQGESLVQEQLARAVRVGQSRCHR